MSSLATASKFIYDGGINKNHERHPLILLAVLIYSN